jgi:spore coat polysaccharide biosynthesis protein SpsF
MAVACLNIKFMQNLPTIIVQARLSSSRLPGKMLKLINGKPILKYVIERLQLCENAGGLIVATSSDESDDAINNLCKRIGVKCFRGELNDVASRFSSLIVEEDINSFVRINGDSPMIDNEIVDHAIYLFNKGEYDIVTNVFPRSFPKGQSVEVIKTDVFNPVVLELMTEEDKEHVTTYFYRNSDDYNILNFSMKPELNHIQLSVDTEEDFTEADKILKSMGKSHCAYPLNEILALKKTLQN